MAAALPALIDRASSPTPAAPATRPRSTRSRPAPVWTLVESSGRNAASGLTRTTRRVGSQAATTVTRTPTTSAPAYQGKDGAGKAMLPLGSAPLANATRP
jgi:hypothetical protein